MTVETDPQRLAAASEQPNLLVVAPPGCGKTELLALRALELIPRLAPNQRILALTFTNRAKANLGDRLQGLLGRERFRRYVAVHNFHGHAAELVLAHGRTLGLPVTELKMPTTKTLRKALEAISTDSASQRSAAEVLAVTKRQPSQRRGDPRSTRRAWQRTRHAGGAGSNPTAPASPETF